MSPTRSKIFLSLLCLFMAACSNTRKLPAGESLFVGSRPHIHDNYADRREKKILPGDLEAAVRPRPNTKILGIRLKLTLYNFIGGDPKKEKGIRHFLRSRFGEPPVLASSVDLEHNQKILQNVLENRGFFYPEVAPEMMVKRRKATAHFHINTGEQYKIRNVEFVTDSGGKITRDIAAQADKTLLQKDQPFNLGLIKAERERIDQQLNEIGYYYFTPDDIIVLTDSTIGNHQVDMYVKVKDEVPEDARTIYKINNVFVYPNYRLADNRNRRSNRDTTRAAGRRRRVVQANRRQLDTTYIENQFYLIGNRNTFKPRVFTSAMQFQPGDVYNRTEHNFTLNRLITMGTFKFVKNEFDPVAPGLLNAYYYLTPNPKKSIQLDLGNYTKSDSRTGSQLNLTWRNRNIMRGAELFTFRAALGFESQPAGGANRPSTYQVLLEPRLSVPRFFVPFFHIKSRSMFAPRTSVYLGYEAVARSPLYLLNSFKTGYGYNWKEDVKREHELFPINVNYVLVDTLNKDTSFYINYGNLLFNGLIIGPTYQFTYNSRGDGPPNRQDFYFNGLADLSGNLLGLFQGSTIVKPKRIFGEQYAQYIKLQTDFRYYLNYGVNKNSIWANRLILGWGYPQGNTIQLPNIKQFFSGGNSSLRGFPSRLVGPGRFHYRDADPVKNRRIIETSGDIKFELNTEVRAQLKDFIHGAVFIDAGNVWTARDTVTYGPLAKFKFNRFLSDLAINTGVGLRFDFNILVLRFDFGIPLRKPWLYNDGVTDVVRKEERKLDKGDIVFNLAIGYPF